MMAEGRFEGFGARTEAVAVSRLKHPAQVADGARHWNTLHENPHAAPLLGFRPLHRLNVQQDRPRRSFGFCGHALSSRMIGTFRPL
jgi:hypothetical protein